MTRNRAGLAGRRSTPGILLLSLAILAVAVLLSLSFGAREVSFEDVVDGVLGRGSDLGALAVSERVPRTAIALLVGSCLGVSGALMQAVTRNPIADPGILGVNNGAALAIVIGVTFFGITGLVTYLWVALLGAAVTAVFVFSVGSLGPAGSTPVTLALAGVATSAALSSAVSAVLLPKAAEADSFRFWQVGSLGRGDWSTLAIALPLAAAALLVALLCSRSLDSLALGDEAAVGQGVRAGRVRMLAAVSGVVLCATATAVAGPIGFVGLMVPHAVRLLVGTSHGWLMTLSALLGASLLTLADVLGRVIARPSEVAVGIITAFIGAPVLVFIVSRTKVRDI